MSFSKAHLFYGVSVDIPEGVKWSMLDDDDKGGIKMIDYGSDGDNLYAVAVAESVTKAELGQPAPIVAVAFNVGWPAMVRVFCKKHGLAGDGSPAWRLAVERF